MHYRALLLACSALVPPFAPSAVFAQGREGEETVMLGAVVITARRFEERLQTAPVAVTPLAGCWKSHVQPQLASKNRKFDR
ncbi:hypothetical protein [Pseudogemmobacter sonorensis]|uniref:hypothetical protein n=1 Tax=Pseudogemmobacter sonorensis TaxID=2989681 RepID=UPI0036C97D20